MEVTCERCNAEYDFDDSLVGESGTSVKCTDCGHVFKIFSQRSGANRGMLQLRFRDGHVELLSSLRELQRRARLGEITLDDEIGREGFEWRKLRDVAELRGFFQAERSPSGTVGVTPSIAGSLAVAPSMQPGTHPAAGKATMLGMGPAGSGSPQRKPSSSSLPAPAPSTLAPPPTRGGVPIGAGQATQRAGSSAPPPSSPSAWQAQPAPAPQRAPQPGQQAPKTPAAKLYLADDDASDPRPSRRSTGGGGLRWIGFAVLLAGGVWLAVNAASRKDTSETDTEAQVDAGLPDAAPPGGDAAASATAESGLSPVVEPKPEAASKPSQNDDAKRKARERKKAKAEAEAAKAAKARAKSRAKPERAKPERSEQVDEQDYGALVGRADRLYTGGDLKEAQALYDKALSLRGSGSEANSGLGFVLLAQGQPGKALAHFDTAARNGFAVANVGRGDALAKLGRPEDAIAAYEDYLHRLPSGSRAKYAKARIANLRPSSTPARAEPEPEAAPVPAAPTQEEQPQPDDGEEYVPAGMAEPEEAP